MWLKSWAQKKGLTSMNSKGFLDRDVFAEDEKIGKAKELGINPED